MTLNRYFIDANIIIRHLTGDHPTLSPKATRFMEKIAKKEILSYITTLVIHEVTYVLQYVYGVNRKKITESLKKLLKLENLEVLDMDKDSLLQALDDFTKYNVDFPDCVYKQILLNQGLEMASFDKDFRKLHINPTTEV